MKKFLTTTLLITSLFLPQHSHAEGDASSALQISQLGELAITAAKSVATAASSHTTSIATYASYVKTNILDPIQRNLARVAAIQGSKNIINLINGSTNGNPLLISNPLQYVTNEGKKAVLKDINYVNTLGKASGGVVADSLIDSTINDVRGSDPNAKLAQLVKPEYEMTVQSNICKEDWIDAQAKAQATAGSADGKMSNEDYQYYKKLLYDDLCKESAATNKATAQRVQEVAKQVPNAVGWNGWLKLTTDNPYTLTMRGQEVVRNNQAQAIGAAKTDLQQGGGIVSQKVCTEYYQDNVATGEKKCKTESVVNTSSALAAAQQNALQTPQRLNELATIAPGSPAALPGVSIPLLDSAGGIFGDIAKSASSFLGAVQPVMNTAGTILGAYNTAVQVGKQVNQITGQVEQIGNQFEKTTDSLDSVFGGNSAQSAVGALTGAASSLLKTTGGTNTSSVTSSSYLQDLSGNPQAKEDLVYPIQSLLNNQLGSLSKLEDADRLIIAKINEYQSNLDGLRACYDSLSQGGFFGTKIVTNPETGATSTITIQPDPRIAEGLNYYQSRTSVNNNILSTINKELSITVPSARTTITAILNKVTASNSTQEISDVFKSYQRDIDINPDLQILNSAGQREAEYHTYGTDLTMALQPNGSITNFNNQCTIIRQQLMQGATSF
jgi:hypothetical protein